MLNVPKTLSELFGNPIRGDGGPSRHAAALSEHARKMSRATATLRNGEAIEVSFDDYTEEALPESQWEDGGMARLASGWVNGGPVCWNNRGQYLDGTHGEHELDILKIDGWDAREFLIAVQSRFM